VTVVSLPARGRPPQAAARRAALSWRSRYSSSPAAVSTTSSRQLQAASRRNTGGTSGRVWQEAFGWTAAGRAIGSVPPPVVTAPVPSPRGSPVSAAMASAAPAANCRPSAAATSTNRRLLATVLQRPGRPRALDYVRRADSEWRHPYQGSAPDPVPQDRTCDLRERRTAGDVGNRSVPMGCGPNVDQTRDAQRTGRLGSGALVGENRTGPTRAPRLGPTRRSSLLSPRAHLDRSATGAREITLDARLLDDHVSAHHGPAVRTEGFKPSTGLLRRPSS
jgi:hypothetical protein